MEYTKLGNSDLEVSRICLGCMGFGNAATGQHSWTVDEDTSRGIIKHALELGINFFDTADLYQKGRLPFTAFNPGAPFLFLGRIETEILQWNEVVLM